MLVQFFVYFQLFSKGRPMIDYENMNKLLQFLDVKSDPKMHWSGDGKVYMHEIVVNKTRNLVWSAQFISFLVMRS